MKIAMGSIKIDNKEFKEGEKQFTIYCAWHVSTDISLYVLKSTIALSLDVLNILYCNRKSLIESQFSYIKLVGWLRRGKHCCDCVSVAELL